MRVDAATLTFLSSMLSTLVVVVGAVAAVRQLRHLRHANELATMNDLRHEWNSDSMREARLFVQTQLGAAMEDQAFLSDLRSAPTGTAALPIVRVTNFFEILAIYRHAGALSERLTFLIWGPTVIGYWKLLRNAIVIKRASQPEQVLDYFEDLAMRAETWLPHQNAKRKSLRRDPAIGSLEETS